MHAFEKNENKRPARTTRRNWHFALVALLFVLAIPLQFIFEHPEEVIENVPMPRWIQQGIQQTSSSFNSFALIPRPLEARYTALVSISNQYEGGLSGPCAVRALLTKLLPAINSARPTMIVVDIGLTGEESSSDSCPTGDQETKELVSTIDAVAKTTPIAIGQASWILNDLTEERAMQLRDQGFGENDVLLRKPMPLNRETKNVVFGLIRSNQNLERVPVVWFAHQDDTSSAKPVPALGFVAAEMYRSTFPSGVHRLQSLEAARYHPVASLLPESDFAVVHAIDVMCPVPPADHKWKNCPDPAGNRDGTNAKLHGRVVVVGFSDNSNDLWNTAVGRLAGYVLQANYIEALLDARTFQPLGFWLTCWLSLLWLMLVELPFWVLKNQIAKGLLFSFVSSIIILFLAKYVALVNFGLYISLFAPSVLLVAVSLLHVIAESYRERGN